MMVYLAIKVNQAGQRISARTGARGWAKGEEAETD